MVVLKEKNYASLNSIKHFSALEAYLYATVHSHRHSEKAVAKRIYFYYYFRIYKAALCPDKLNRVMRRQPLIKNIEAHILKIFREIYGVATTSPHA